MQEPSSTAYASLDRDLADIEAELRQRDPRAPAREVGRKVSYFWIPVLPLLSAILVYLALR